VVHASRVQRVWMEFGIRIRNSEFPSGHLRVRVEISVSLVSVVAGPEGPAHMQAGRLHHKTSRYACGARVSRASGGLLALVILLTSAAVAALPS